MSWHSMMHRANRAVLSEFGEPTGIRLQLPSGIREIQGVFENPDAGSDVPDGGFIRNSEPAFVALTTTIFGLTEKTQVTVLGEPLWVSHIGTNEAGLTRVTLVHGTPGKPAEPLSRWSTHE